MKNTEFILAASLIDTAIGKLMKAQGYIRTASEKEELLPLLNTIKNMTDAMIEQCSNVNERKPNEQRDYN